MSASVRRGIPTRIGVGTWFLLKVGGTVYRKRIAKITVVDETLFDKSERIVHYSGGTTTFKQFSIDETGYLTLIK